MGVNPLLEQELKILIQENKELRDHVIFLQAKIRHLEEQNDKLSELLNNNHNTIG